MSRLIAPYITDDCPSPTELSVSRIIAVLHQCRFDLSTEKAVQQQIEDALRSNGISFEREKRLSAADIPDFLVDRSVVIECKLRGKAQKMAVYKQLQRYALHGEVIALILATNISMSLPSEINGKPAYLASLSRGWI